ncbi:N-acetylmuramic acid 6-phosphate etherase [Escherichia coli]|uniref:N-acetylmuramic acid 6-phosphate etherase n=1 Tax=Escherichia coli TaxID=562 RepID=A0A447XU33_ECOLX|nr:N-acetylmuramic acid 6-phosphate etherase [Escherichia coli]
MQLEKMITEGSNAASAEIDRVSNAGNVPDYQR